MPPSITTPEETYKLFSTDFSIHSIAKSLGITRVTLRRWWVGRFGLEAYENRIARVIESQPRVPIEEKKNRRKAYKKANKKHLQEVNSQWAHNNPEKVAESKKKYRKDHSEEIRAYGRQYYSVNKKSILAARNSEANLAKHHQWEKTYYTDHPEKLLVKFARKRAKDNGVPFNITAEDIRYCFPADGCCPITKQPFERGNGKVGPRSMSLDRIIPELGYVPGNIAVISHLANTIKQNCTDPEVFRRIADYLERAQEPVLKKAG